MAIAAIAILGIIISIAPGSVLYFNVALLNIVAIMEAFHIFKLFDRGQALVESEIIGDRHKLETTEITIIGDTHKLNKLGQPPT